MNFMYAKATYAIFFTVIITVLSFSIRLNAQEVRIKKPGETSIEIKENTYLKFCAKNTLSEIKSFDVNTPKGDFTELFVTGYTPTQKVGYPKLPAIRKLIEVPLDAKIKVKIKSYDVTEYKLEDIGIENPIIPVQPPLAKSFTGKRNFYYNSAAYRKNRYLNTSLVTVEEIGYMRGTRITRVNIFPIQYNPGKKTIKVYSNIDFEIVFNNSSISKTKAAKQKYYSPYFKSSTGKIFNYKALGAKDTITKAPVKYVIVSDIMFQNVLQPFIQWKTKKGFKVIEAYTNDPNVGNTTSSIKSYLQGLYNSASVTDPAPTFVLFVGDIAQIPAHSGTTGGHISDMPYCEFTNDFIPEMYYGRFSANNLLELQPQIDKTLEYEQYTMTNTSFLNEVVMIAGVDNSMALTYGNGQINYGNTYYFNTAHGLTSHTYLYPASASSASLIIQDVSDGVGFVNYTAHGGSNGWVDPSFKTYDVPTLQNEGKYPLMIGNACLTNTFNITECFGEALLRANKKGAIGYIGSTNTSYWDEDYYWALGAGTISANPTYTGTSLGAFDRLFHDNGEPYSEWFETQGQMNYAGNLSVTQSGSTSYDYYWETYHLMGDPSLMIYFSVPPQQTPNYAPLLPIGINSFTVTAAPYSYIALSMNGILHGAAFADSTGNAVVQIIPVTTPGTADVVITKQNKQPFIGTVTVASPSGPYVLKKDHKIIDITGNNNSKADYGETISLDITLINYGSQVGTSVYAILSSTDQFINITDSTESWGNILPNDTSTKTNAFTFTIKNFIPDQHLVPLNLLIRDSIGNFWNSTFTLIINAPNFAIGNITLDDNTSGNGNGRIDPGETMNIIISTINNGHSNANNTQGILTTYMPGITINNSTYNFNTFNAGASANASFNISVNSNVAIGTDLDFEYKVFAGLYEQIEYYRFLIGTANEDWETANFNKYPWSTGGHQPWILTSSTVYEGQYCVKSGGISDLESSEFSITLNIISNDSISFYLKVSSEEDYDQLEFFIDDIRQEKWSGEKGWLRTSFPVTIGTHTFKWKYTKDVWVGQGSDCAWVDFITLPPFVGITTDIVVHEMKEMEFSCYPNPTQNSTTLTYKIIEATSVSLQVFNSMGSLIAELVNNQMVVPGTYKTQYNTTKLKAGIYYCVLNTGEKVSTKKLMVIK